MKADEFLEKQITERVLEMLLLEQRGLKRDIQSKAADLEIAIVDAINVGKPKTYQTLALNIAQTLKANGISGAASKPPKTQISDSWQEFGGTDTTPKTDVLVGDSRISLKMGSSQFMSGERGEAKATLLAAIERTGLNKSVAEKALQSVEKLQKNIKYSTDVTELRKMPGYKDPDTGEKVPGRAGAEVKKLMGQEAGQNRFQKDLAAVLDPNTNPGLKLAFVQEAIDGQVKFANGIGTASYLLTVAGKETLYGQRGVASANVPDLSSFLHFEKIDQNLAVKYENVVSIIVKFKTRSSGSSDVVGIMLQEAKDFREKLKQLLAMKTETRHLYGPSMTLISEGAWDQLKAMLGSAWDRVKALWQRTIQRIDALAADLKQKIINAAKEGIEVLLGFLGIDMEVAASQEINWFI